jgi:hypothetical protein
MNEAHGQDYDATQHIGDIDREEIRVMVHDGLRSLRTIAVALKSLSERKSLPIFEQVFGKHE